MLAAWLLLACTGTASDAPTGDSGPSATTGTTDSGAPPTAASLYAFLAAQQHPEHDLLRSYVRHDALPVAFRDYLAQEDPAFVYDSALAALAWLGRGAKGDEAHAVAILDGLLAVQRGDGSLPDVVSLQSGATAGTSTGNLAWVMLAWLEGHRQLGEVRWLEAAGRAAAFLLDPAHDLRNPEGFGGFRLAPGSTVVATEHALDLYPALSRLAAAPPVAGAPAASVLAEAALEARLFAESRFDPATGAVLTGTGPDGVTTARDPIPLDTQTWSVLALGGAKWGRSLTWAQGPKALWVTSSACPTEGGMPVEGPSYSSADVSDVWTEGLAQLQLAADRQGDAATAELAAAGLDRIRRLAPNGDGQGLVATCSEVATGFGSSYYNALAVGATAWAALAATGTNPYWPDPPPEVPTVSLDVPPGGSFACTGTQPCRFTVTGSSTGVAGTTQRVHVLVEPTDPAVPSWFTQVAATVASDGSWSGAAQLGSTEAGGEPGDGLRVVALVVEGPTPAAVLTTITPATVPGVAATTGLLDATVQ